MPNDVVLIENFAKFSLLGMLLFFVLLLPAVFLIGFLRREREAELGKVCFPKFVLAFGIILSSVFAPLAILSVWTEKPFWEQAFFFVFALLGAFLIVAYANDRIFYDENGFAVQNLLGMQKTFSYDQITGLRTGKNNSYLFCGKRKIVLPLGIAGRKTFIRFAKKRYRTLFDGMAIPEIRESRRDIFNGNVARGETILFVYLMVAVLLAFFLFLTVRGVFFSPSTTENTVKQSVVFEAFRIEGDVVTVTSTENRTYTIRSEQSDLIASAIQSACEDKLAATVYVRPIEPKDGEAYSAEAVFLEDARLLSFDETNRLKIRHGWPFVAIFVAFGVVWILLFAATVIVGRNPQRFSPKIVRLFFRRGSIRT